MSGRASRSACSEAGTLERWTPPPAQAKVNGPPTGLTEQDKEFLEFIAKLLVEDWLERQSHEGMKP